MVSAAARANPKASGWSLAAGNILVYIHEKFKKRQRNIRSQLMTLSRVET
jgi:hypothetical protein